MHVTSLLQSRRVHAITALNGSKLVKSEGRWTALAPTAVIGPNRVEASTHKPASEGSKLHGTGRELSELNGKGSKLQTIGSSELPGFHRKKRVKRPQLVSRTQFPGYPGLRANSNDCSPQEGTSGLPRTPDLEVSHSRGECRPCAWFWKPSGCLNGAGCRHCHECPPGEANPDGGWRIRRAVGRECPFMDPRAKGMGTCSFPY